MSCGDSIENASLAAQFVQWTNRRRNVCSDMFSVMISLTGFYTKQHNKRVATSPEALCSTGAASLSTQLQKKLKKKKNLNPVTCT